MKTTQSKISLSVESCEVFNQKTAENDRNWNDAEKRISAPPPSPLPGLGLTVEYKKSMVIIHKLFHKKLHYTIQFLFCKHDIMENISLSKYLKFNASLPENDKPMTVILTVNMTVI